MSIHDLKDPDIHVLDGWMWETKIASTIHKTVCDYLYGWIKKTVTNAKISPKMVSPRDIAGNEEEEKEDLF